MPSNLVVRAGMSVAVVSLVASQSLAGCAASVHEPMGDEEAVWPPPTYEVFRDSLPRDPDIEGVYLVDGDIRATEPQVRDFYDRYVASASEPPVYDDEVGLASESLVVNRIPVPGTCSWVRPRPWLPPVWVCTPPSMADDVWSPTARTAIRFCIDRDFGANRAAVAEAMQQAAAAWERVAGVRFVYLPGQDASCEPTNGNVDFDVMLDPVSPLNPATGGALYGANASYPSVPRLARSVRVHASTVTSSGLTTTLTHELGHMLGFQHEHIRVSQLGASAVCSWDARTPGSSLTSYDPDSIMHYQGCNGSTSSSGLAVTGTDAAGARSVYGAPLATPHPCAHSSIVTGGPLDALCGSAIAQVCAVDPFCCTTAWDELCIDRLGGFL